MTLLKPVFNRLRRLTHNQEGATAIEYALIATLIFVAIIGAVSLFGESMGNMYNALANAISNTL